MCADITVLVGTTKGAFLLSSDKGRQDWSLTGPHCDGWSINHVIGDAGTGQLWAGGGGEWPGAGVWRSADGGDSWSLTKLSGGQQDEWAASDPEFAKIINWEPQDFPFTGQIENVWSLSRAHGRLWAGGKPGVLLVSEDDGATWALNDGFANFPGRENWSPGAAGLVLHTIVPHPQDPAKVWLGISSAGVFASEDGGQSWERRNRMSNADACGHHDHPAAPRDGETGHCVHNMVRADGTGDLLYQQNHHGVWRSSDGGRSWDDITAGLPSTFGFPIAVNPHDPDMIWVLPLNGDSIGRYPPDASAAVWKSADRGETWTACREGLPQGRCFFTVLRQAMATDQRAQTGVYFGTNTGSVFVSRDEGETWQEIAEHLPTILSVEVLDRG
ncbi:WD40/YVTN/BNR-like repeat-containing protein [Shimia biformata]|uniref:WD40/YVTN/BNR-like repeat-containing protein n=1 Tax=Shimia biformata TaxID=1294299 RepID=UPI00194FB893|nr:sialidase family protein [Shimia biformata]